MLEQSFRRTETFLIVSTWLSVDFELFISRVYFSKTESKCKQDFFLPNLSYKYVLLKSSMTGNWIKSFCARFFGLLPLSSPVALLSELIRSDNPFIFAKKICRQILYYIYSVIIQLTVEHTCVFYEATLRFFLRKGHWPCSLVKCSKMLDESSLLMLPKLPRWFQCLLKYSLKNVVYEFLLYWKIIIISNSVK